MDKQPINLSDLDKPAEESKTKKEERPISTTNDYKEVDMSQFVEIKKKVSPQRQFELEELQLIDEGIERTKKDLMKNVIQPFKEACVQASLENQADDIQDNEIEDTIIHNDEPSVDDDLNELLSQDEYNKNIAKDDEVIMNYRNTPFMEDPEEKIIDTNKEIKPEPHKQVEVKKDEAKADTEKSENNIKNTSNESVIHTQVKTDYNIDDFKGQETISDEDLKELLDTDEAEPTEEETEEAKKAIKSLSDEIAAKLNINFTEPKDIHISSKAISVNSVIKDAAPAHIQRATWVLPNTGRLITISALGGEEIENFNPSTNRGMNDDMYNKLTFTTIYNHVIDPNKPATMTEWLKTINWFDSFDLYFALYLGTFQQSNFVTYSCDNPKCKHIFLSEVNWRDMVVYNDDESKKTYENLLKNGTDVTNNKLNEKIYRVNEKFAIGFHAPSIYDITFGASSLDKEFINKYANTLTAMAYMGNIYYIKDGTYYPIDCKEVKNNISKTVRNRIVAYYNILKTFTSDEYSIISKGIVDITKKYHNMSTFKYPSVKCPKCGKEVPETKDLNPINMLFSRHQLAHTVNYSIDL